MSIAVGQILDKYEILEKVGQGGMAVVYRGLDHSLKRPVAVKVLHHHLAEHQEARDRFEREAHAVAKLRHENILEIFDFSGKNSDESYIVTEFIEGQTLISFISDHPLKYPEVGAMIALQVCRALGHAHAHGVLHRDVKPENIMIRSDGLVKLTDFGIARLLDAQQMTMTGQLIGSPAYMAPEHVEGEAVDFRTDVFAVGVVLYQLVAGELPFQGKNAHEVLIRVTEGVFRDPRAANPLVGNELCRIIKKALARRPDDRYPDITTMAADLERYLRGSGMNDFRQELARFFDGPVAYEVALQARLVDHLTRRGRELLAEDQVAALDLFNRVLTLDPEHRDVLDMLDRLSRKRRGLVILAIVAGGALVLGGLGWGTYAWHEQKPADTLILAGPDEAGGELRVPNETPRLGDSAWDGADAGAAPDSGRPDSDQPDSDRGERVTRPERPAARSRDAGRAGTGAVVETGPRATRTFTLTVAPRRSEYRVDTGPWQPIDHSAPLRVGPGAHTVEIRNDACCQAAGYDIAAGQTEGPIDVTLGYLPATITPQCARSNVSVQIDGVSARLDRKFLIPITGALGRRTVTVMFIGEHTDEHEVPLRYNEARDVTCRFE